MKTEGNEPLDGCLFGRSVAKDRPAERGIEHIGLERKPGHRLRAVIELQVRGELFGARSARPGGSPDSQVGARCAGDGLDFEFGRGFEGCSGGGLVVALEEPLYLRFANIE